MNLEMITRKFAQFSSLDGEAMQDCLPFCRDAAAEITLRCRAEAAAAEPLAAAAAALAYYRWCLACFSGSAVPHLGEATLATADTVKAAFALMEQYLQAASPWLREDRFYFGQVRA